MSAATLPALREIKLALLAGGSEPLEEALERFAVAQAVLMDSPEHLDRTRAFLAHSDR